MSLVDHQVSAEVDLEKVALPPASQPYVAGALAVHHRQGRFRRAPQAYKADWKAPGLGLVLEDSDSNIDGLVLNAGGGQLAAQQHAVIKLRVLDLAQRRVEEIVLGLRGC